MLLSFNRTPVAQYESLRNKQILYKFNNFAAGAVLLKTDIPSFVVKQEPYTPPNLMMEVKTLRELCLSKVGPFVSL